MDCSMPGLPVHRQLLEFTQTHVHWVWVCLSMSLVMLSNIFILCHPLFLLPSIFPSLRVFSNESVIRIRWAKYWRFSFSISPSNEYSGLIPFRMDWLDLICSLRDSQESSKVSFLQAPQFKSVNSSVLSFIYSPALTSTHDRWKDHSLD